VEVRRVGQVSFHARETGEGPRYEGSVGRRAGTFQRVFLFCDTIYGTPL
jgi:hypothetical protein